MIAHNHYDHLEATTIRHLVDKAGRFIAPLSVGARLESWGVPADKITELGWGVFSLGRNPWYESIDNAVKSAKELDLPIDVPKMGEKYADGFVGEDWWEDRVLRKE